MSIHEGRATAAVKAIIKTISIQMASGRKEVSSEPARVILKDAADYRLCPFTLSIIDMRDLRSSLPSLLHASGLLVLPVTLTVGDCILTPDIYVERKSNPDLIPRFDRGPL